MTRSSPLAPGPVGYCWFALPLAFGVSSGEATPVSPAVRRWWLAANLRPTAQLTLRWWESGHFPISNLYESLLLPAGPCTLTQLLVGSAPGPHRCVPAETERHKMDWAASPSPASPAFDRLQQGHLLVPACAPSWLVHARSGVIDLCSYAALLVGSLPPGGAVHDRDPAQQLRSSSIGSGWFPPGKLATSGGDLQLSSSWRSASTSNSRGGSLSYRTITVGFLLAVR